MTLTYTQIRNMPKVLLHDHLDGGLRPQTILDLAQKIGLNLPKYKAQDLGAWFVEISNSENLEAYLRSFSYTVALMQTRENLIRVASECVQDLAEDGIIYAETRYAPEQHATAGLTLEEIVASVHEGISQGEAEALKLGHKIHVKQILCALRNGPNVANIARLAEATSHLNVAGFDLAGPEKNFSPKLFSEVFASLRNNFMPVTLHAGEGAGIESITEALSVGSALRLGHGVRIVEDIFSLDKNFLESGQYFGSDAFKEVAKNRLSGLDTKYCNYSLGSVAKWILDREIVLEISPSSNLHTKVWKSSVSTIGGHPFDLLYRLGFMVTVNTDNRLMSGVTLSQEYFNLVETFGYSTVDLRKFVTNAAQGAFLSYRDKQQLLLDLERS